MSSAVASHFALRWHARTRTGIDHVLLYAALALVVLGLVMVASASISLGTKNHGVPLFYFWKQMSALGVAGLFACVLLMYPLSALRRDGGIMLILGMILLGVVLLPGIGHTVNGSTRWIPLGFMNLQPSELMKLFVVIYLAGYLVRHHGDVRQNVGGFIRPIVVLAIIAALLLGEPDYGATVVLFTTVFGMLFLSGARWINFLAWGVLAVIGLAVALVAAPYRIDRLKAFLDPWSDPFNSGFQLTQALIAVGRGDWFGVGLGNSIQKLFYLPEAHTDFLFAVIAEELGFVGMTLVIALFSVVVFRTFQVAAGAEQRQDFFSAYLCYGIGLLIIFQAFVNIGVNLGALPTKGLALPLMSFGGNSLMVSVGAIALVLKVSYHNRREPTATEVGGQDAA
jgi:cell division protein FtsW